MITIQQQPGLWSPIYNPMVFILDSTNTGQSNFKYLVDIYVSGQADYVRLAIDADPTYAQGFADIHRIVESYVTSNPAHKTLNGFQIATNSMIAYEVKFGEQYGPASSVTDYPMLTVTGTKYAFNAAYTPHDWLSFSGASIAVETTNTLLTIQPDAKLSTFNLTEDLFNHYITNTSGSIYFAEIKTYDSAGVLIQTAQIENPYQAVASYSHRRMMFYSGARALNAATLYSGTQPLITSSVYSYVVKFTTFAGGLTARGSTVTRNDNCNAGRTPLTLHWKNRLGGFDSFQFVMINRYKTETKKSTYERKLGAMGQNSWAYNHYDSGKIVMDTKNQARYELQSDWISLADQEFLMELIESPEVYFDDGTNFFSVIVTSPTVAELRQASYGDVEFNTLKVTIEFAVDYWRQRG